MPHSAARAHVSFGAMLALLVPLLVVLSAGPTASANQGTMAPLMIRGTITGSASLPEGAVVATVEPAASKLAALPEGAQYSRYRLPLESIHRDGDDVEVRLAPDALPDEYVDADGLVTVVIDAIDAERGRFGTVMASVRRITVGAETHWAPPMYAPESLDVAPATRGPAELRAARAKAPATAASSVRRAYGDGNAPIADVLARGLPNATARMRSAASDTVSRLAREEADVSSTDLAQAAAAGNCGLGDRRIREATVGTSYPKVYRSKSWLTYGGSSSSSFGYAVRGGDGWYESSGTKTIADSWGGDFSPRHFARSYRVDVVYRYQVCRSYKYGTVTSRKWIPTKQTGGIRSYRLDSRPSWRSKCAPIRINTWWRGRESGNAYTLSYGVKFKDVVGFNMMSKRGYSSSARLYYRAPRRRSICGNNDWPARASKMVERVWKARSY